MDESGYRLTPFVMRTWALMGTTPVLRHPCGTWRKLSAISAIAIQYHQKEMQANLYFRLHPDKTIRKEEVVEFLRQLSYHIEGDAIFIWDNLKSHKSRKVKKFLTRHPRFQGVFLPPYCPELNPDEGVWNWTKTKELANVCVIDMEEMVHRVRGSLRKIQHRKNIIHWCLNDSKLPWGELRN